MVEKQYSGTELDNDLKEGLGVITERAQSLNIFIQRYQKLAKLPLPTKTLFNIEPLVQSVTLLFPDANIELDSKALVVYADKDQLQQVLVNLLKNACESMYDNPKEKINVYWRKDNQYFEIEILDHGTGIKNMDNLFVPFYTTKPQGTGIGLSLSRQILVNHGGDLILKNRPEHAGVQATLLIPA
jgi:signal transduction histidine kinase